jgi:hypothetical protein
MECRSGNYPIDVGLIAGQSPPGRPPEVAPRPRNLAAFRPFVVRIDNDPMRQLRRFVPDDVFFRRDSSPARRQMQMPTCIYPWAVDF